MTQGAEPSSAGSETHDGLDLTADVPLTGPMSDLVTTRRFDPHPIQERVRTGVALAVIGAVILETLIVTIAFVLGAITPDSLPSVTAAIFTPMVGIAGTVLGFYFGSHRPGAGA
jgi:hypothetical protein